MYPFVKLFGISIPTYSLCALLGLSITFQLFSRLLRKKLLLNKYLPIFLTGLLGAMFGAKLFGILSETMYSIYTTGSFNLADCMYSSGIVYYGGLLGTLTAVRIMCCFNERKFDDISDVLGVTIPLFHAFGRIGCYLAGCCYGCEYSGLFALPYRIGADGVWVMRFPTQLCEVIFEVTVFIIHMIRHMQPQKGQASLLARYLFSYSVFRFILEFFRGDTVRGVFWGISFSQIISVLIWTCLFLQHKSRQIRKEVVL